MQSSNRGPYPDWLDHWDADARKAAQHLENQNLLPNGFTAKHYPLTLREQAESRRLRAAMEAAPDADTFVALAKGDIVPEHRVDQGLLAYHRRRVQHRQPTQGGGG